MASGRSSAQCGQQQFALPCEKAAASLGLQCHQIPTFTGWQMPADINLIIAVSFGLFVPPRLLRQAKYGGLNVHPSFLPDLRGPAPIHHAVLHGDTHTGVSLQTLHEKTFDHGTVLAQTPAPGIAILAHPTLSLTTRKLGIECAEMLVQGLRDGLHVSPYENAGWRNADGLRHAPKLYPGDLKIQWDTWSAADWQRRLVMKRAIWTNAMTNKGKRKRVIFHDARPVSATDVQGTRGMVATVEDGEGDPVRREVIVNQGDGSVYFLTGRGEWVRVRRGRLEAEVEKDAAMVVRSLLVRDV
ncbi:Methionyl-tRNA formyltransferase-like protein [Emericellopsis cladophorae]|uniref:Methionyl-tRNA formyltransferase-like protein n=1 Tax=Emericellopsis cladophorae TaxID=2686198 RepID=A0A9P9Y200_9HYPO|nr:Methionyl-tRNA formyltransferase-like protein [Emericellopsis cladophorae]KAI6781683.1 Methionyl-tRNA formyltransferase-like protein [Emericellopsis cladophorae]